MELTEKTVSKNYVYRGKIITVRADDALRPDGKPCKRELIEEKYCSLNSFDIRTARWSAKSLRASWKEGRTP